MRRKLIGTLLAGAALAAVPTFTGTGSALADGPGSPGGAPVCVTANVGGLDLNQLCKGPG